MKTCMECNHSKVIQDPDPHDWFCDDDKAVVCDLTTNPSMDKKSDYAANRQKYRCITVSCRPYNLEKETPIPEWCSKGYYK